MVTQLLKNSPAMPETQIRSLGQKDPLEKAMAIHQYSRLEKFMDRGTWRATVHGVTKSQTQLSDWIKFHWICRKQI